MRGLRIQDLNRPPNNLTTQRILTTYTGTFKGAYMEQASLKPQTLNPIWGPCGRLTVWVCLGLDNVLQGVRRHRRPCNDPLMYEFWGLGFRVLGFRGLGFRGLGFRK